MTNPEQAATNQENSENAATSAPQTAVKPGLFAAGDEDTSTPNALAAQEELDRRQQAEKDAEQGEDVAVLPDVPQAGPFAKPSAEANQACLDALADLWGVKDIPLSEYLDSLSLTQAAPNGLLVKGSDNDYLVGKDYIEAENDTITARAAFEMALLAQANPVIAERGVVLSGDLQERYLLTLAAEHMGIKITNPVHDNDLPAELAEECAALKTEWHEVLKNPLNEPAAPVAEDAAEEQPVSEDSAEPAAAETAQETPAPSVLKPDDFGYFDKAKALVRETGAVSNALLQRQLHVGFNRASRLIAEMENQGIVSAPKVNGKRDVLIAPVPGSNL